MFSATMLVIIFLEISVAVVTILGSILLASQYMKLSKIEDLYVCSVLTSSAIADLGMIYSQIAFNLQSPFAYIGFKIFLFCIIMIAVSVWFHLTHIYGFRSSLLTMLVLALSCMTAYLISRSHVSLAFQDGVIVPIGIGRYFILGFGLLISIIAVEAVFSIIGLKKIKENLAARYKISKTAGIFFFTLFACLFIYITAKIVYFYALTWFFAFFAMLYLFLFSMIPEGSPLTQNPLDYFRTRILFKLIITLVIAIIISLEGMSLISINIGKKALSESVIESYKRVADDTIQIINKSRLDRSSEKITLNSITKALEITRIGDRGSVFLVSPDKKIYINRGKRWISLGTTQALSVKKNFFGASSGGEVDIFGEKVIAAYIPINKLGWGLIVGQPIEYAYARIKQMESTFIIFVLIWIGFTVAIGLVLARNIEDPIKAVKKGILKIADGDMDYKISINKIDEIGELAQTFNKMTTELKDSQDSLLRSERLASLGFMAAGMAHEIKNALVPLRTLTDILSVSGGDKAFIAKFNELVPREIERINTLSTDLLQYSKPSEPVFEYLNVNDTIEETVKFLEIQARKKNVDIKLKLSKVSEIKADRQKLIEVFANIMLNATEAMNKGEITVSSYDKDENVVVEIADNGPGIPEENKDRVFVPFFTTKKEGTGMGLAIVQRIMHDHGGTIDFTSTHGIGTQFFLSFPKKS